VSAGLLQPRFRRILSIGALLDESVQLYRQHWQTFALFGAVALVPSWLLVLLADLLHVSSRAAQAATDFGPGRFVGFLAFTLAASLFGLIWSVAAMITAVDFATGRQPQLGEVYQRALARLLAVLGAGVLVFLGVVLLTIAAAVPFVVSVFGALGVPLATGLLIYWWRSPGGRTPWLKWLIILSAPFGLLAYYSVRWALFLPALVIEHLGPLESLRRSSQLVEHQWFRAFAVLTITSIILAVLISVPVSIVDVIVAIFDAPGLINGSSTPAMIVNTASILCQLLFSSIGAIAYVLLFIDLRNRREGTDLLERVSSLEAATV
jgi:hypothetical protein